MLNQDDDFEPYLNLFFESSNIPSLAWISNIRSGRFDKAYENLLLVSDKENVIEKKKVNGLQVNFQIALRLCKLCFVTHYGTETTFAQESIESMFQIDL